jgi:O-methyltransferase
MSASVSHRQDRRSLPEHLDTPFYRVLVAVGLFRPLRKVSRLIFRLKTQRRALRGQGLVPEEALKETYTAAVTLLREKTGGVIGDYLEFGVCHGSSMACMHDVLTATGTMGVRKFGFDSFQGLPPEADDQDGGFFSEGQFGSSLYFAYKLLTKRGIDWSTTFLIQGWFKDTCTQQTIDKYNIRKVGIVMIDCDIYSASKEALDFVGPLLAEHSVIVFDDWNSGNLADKNLGESKAFEEFLTENPLFRVTRLPSTYGNSAVFHVTRKKGLYDRK